MTNGANSYVLAAIPATLAGGFGLVGFVFRLWLKSLGEKMDTLDTSMSKVAKDILDEIERVDRALNTMDRRIVRLESWRDLVTIPDVRRRMQDRETDGGSDDGSR